MTTWVGNPVPLTAGSTGAFLTGISYDGGTIVGWQAFPTGARACYWPVAALVVGTPVLLPNIANATAAQANAVSLNGTYIVGQSTQADGTQHAVIWSSLTGYTPVDYGYLDSTHTLAAWNAVNSDGTEVYGIATNPGNTPDFKPIYASPPSALTLAGFPGGFTFSAQLIACAGTTGLAVGVATASEFGAQHSYYQTGPLATPALLDASTYTQTEPVGVSYDGTVIVGQALNALAQAVPCYWTGAPSSWTLTAIDALPNSGTAWGATVGVPGGTMIFGIRNSSPFVWQAGVFTSLSNGVPTGEWALGSNSAGTLIIGSGGDYWTPGTTPPPTTIPTFQLADLFFANVTAAYDLSNTANRRAFRTAQGGAVYLGNTGANVLGTQPPFFLSVQSGGAAGGANTFANNQGSAGALTISSGPLTYSTTNPPGSATPGTSAPTGQGPSLVGDYRNGNLYTFNLDYALDDGVQRKWLRTWRATAKASTKPQQHSALTIVLETGAQVPDGTSPQVMLRWSDDGGHNYSEQIIEAAGPVGATSQRVRFRRLGATRELTGTDRLYEISSTDPWKIAIVSAEIE